MAALCVPIRRDGVGAAPDGSNRQSHDHVRDRAALLGRVLPLPCPAPGPTAGGVTPGPPPAGARRPGGEAEARAAQADRTALTAPCRSVAARDARRRAPWAEGSSLFEQSRLCLSTAERMDPADVVVGFGPRATLGRPLLEAQARAAGAHRLALPDQHRHRLATLRRTSVDRSRRAGQRLGGGSTTHAGQGPLGPYIGVWRRLYPARRRRPGF